MGENGPLPQSNVVRMRRGNPGGAPAPSHPVVPRRKVAAPRSLDAAGRRLFRSLVGDLEPAGLFAAPDAEQLELYVMAVQVARKAGRELLEADELTVTDEKNKRLAKHPLAQVFRDNVGTSLMVGKQLGITPGARLRLNLAVEPEPDDGEGLFDT
jgi:P27 family predicted phage terminase small subunit